MGPVIDEGQVLLKNVSYTLKATTKFINLITLVLKMKKMVTIPKSKSMVTPQLGSSSKVNTSTSIVSSYHASDVLLPLCPYFLPIFHHYCEHGHLRSHCERVSFNPCVQDNAINASSSSHPCVTPWSQRPHLSHSFACSYYLCSIIGHLVRQCPRYLRSSSKRSFLLLAHSKKNKFVSKITYGCVHGDYSIWFS